MLASKAGACPNGVHLYSILLALTTIIRVFFVILNVFALQLQSFIVQAPGFTDAHLQPSLMSPERCSTLVGFGQINPKNLSGTNTLA